MAAQAPASLLSPASCLLAIARLLELTALPGGVTDSRGLNRAGTCSEGDGPAAGLIGQMEVSSSVVHPFS